MCTSWYGSGCATRHADTHRWIIVCFVPLALAVKSISRNKASTLIADDVLGVMLLVSDGSELR